MDPLSLLQPGGSLSQKLPGYEMRQQQAEMLLTVCESLKKRAIALIEAGTGTGKSLAYLLPSILTALHKKEKIVISTHTIALQEQLIYKDIPLAQKVLQIPFKAVLVKGMGNYICLRKLQDLQEMPLLLEESEKQELDRLENFVTSMQEGSKTALPFIPTPKLWEQIAADSAACTHVKCPHYQDCPFFKARKEAADAQVLVVNHHLFFSDLSLRDETGNFKETALLPPYSNVIFDEAHHLESVAAEHFSDKVSQFYILKLLGDLFLEKSGPFKQKNKQLLGKFWQLKEKLSQASFETSLDLSVRLNIDIPAKRKELQKTLFEAFEVFFQLTSLSEKKEDKLLLKEHHFNHLFWKEEITPKATLLIDSLKSFCTSLTHLDAFIKEATPSSFQEATKGIRIEIQAINYKLNEQAHLLETFLNEPFSEAVVRWIEIKQIQATPHIQLVKAKLHIDDKLANSLFEKIDTAILCSATLTTHQNFSFIRTQLGLNKPSLKTRTIIEKILPSPFNFSNQALFLVPKDLPHPSQPHFLEESIPCIVDALRASQGNAFVLFTSYQMLVDCYQKVSTFMQNDRLHFLKQNDASKGALLTAFKQKPKSILFGTDSFWEGIDIAGEALKLVILVKLPFQVPSDPLLQAKAEALKKEGKSPFFDLSLPQAICKFKQGFGRLIRHHQDRGCVICLDTRLSSKTYGKQFLNTLPPCRKELVPKQALSQRLKQFYYPKKLTN